MRCEQTTNHQRCTYITASMMLEVQKLGPKAIELALDYLDKKVSIAKRADAKRDLIDMAMTADAELKAEIRKKAKE
jgi:hypothetical protein